MAISENVNHARFEVFDGQGGGLVDTGISVNPGDAVTVSASGQIWAGVFGVGAHGPEGWPGWKANTGAPQPAGTANCLVIRFGNGRWIEAGPFWEGSPDANSGGRLQLNVNDNNPYNGDPKRRWEVFVTVTRAGVSADVYI
jgi:hypothetical protein